MVDISGQEMWSVLFSVLDSNPNCKKIIVYSKIRVSYISIGVSVANRLLFMGSPSISGHFWGCP